MKKWHVEDAAEMYNIKGWGASYFDINDKGHVVVTPKKDGVEIDLRELMDELSLRDISAPVLLRFPDIIDNRIETISTCYKKAAKEYGFQGECFSVFPIKVNQMQPVVEEIVAHGKKYNLGLEAGSKPELHAVLAANANDDTLIICNGYKDESFIELGLLAQKMGKRIFLVAEKLNELNLIARSIVIYAKTAAGINKLYWEIEFSELHIELRSFKDSRLYVTDISNLRTDVEMDKLQTIGKSLFSEKLKGVKEFAGSKTELACVAAALFPLSAAGRSELNADSDVRTNLQTA